MPTRIVVLTTTEGRSLLEERLLRKLTRPRQGSGKVSWVERMAQDLGVDPLPLSESDVLVPVLDSGEEIPDAHSAEQLHAMGSTMFEVLRETTANSDSAVFFSLSGGRKSMSHIAGQCMSALARRQDKLLHVIVEPAWLEGAQSEFLYRVPNGQRSFTFEDDEGVLHAVTEDKIALQLTEEPFFRLRPLLEQAAKAEGDTIDRLSFEDAIGLLSPPTGELILEVSEGSGDAWLGDKSIAFGSRRARAYLTLLAKRRRVNHPLTDDEWLEWLKLFVHQDNRADWTNAQYCRDFVKDHLQKRPIVGAEWQLGIRELTVPELQRLFEFAGGAACSMKSSMQLRFGPEISNLADAWEAVIPPLLDGTLYGILGGGKKERFRALSALITVRLGQ
jgi:CRISPR-associated protein (TIGR02584 family)